jgi:hypothetical protein
MSERLFALTKVEPGDYLLPGNDERTLWRIAKYEDVETFELGIESDCVFWGVWIYTRRGAAIALLPEDFLEWDYWRMEVSSCRTRAEAIAEVERMMG